MNKKHTIAVVLSVVLFVVLAGLSIHAWDNHQRKVWLAEQVKAAQTAATIQHTKEVQAEVAQRQLVCNQQQAAYNALPLATKKKTPAPVCDLTPIQ